MQFSLDKREGNKQAYILAQYAKGLDSYVTLGREKSSSHWVGFGSQCIEFIFIWIKLHVLSSKKKKKKKRTYKGSKTQMTHVHKIPIELRVNYLISFLLLSFP